MYIFFSFLPYVLLAALNAFFFVTIKTGDRWISFGVAAFCLIVGVYSLFKHIIPIRRLMKENDEAIKKLMSDIKKRELEVQELLDKLWKYPTS